jgi:hypothetical protein
MSLYRKSLSVFALALLAGCTPMRWERPDTDPATAEADSVECRSIARVQHRRLTEQPFLIPYFVHVRDNKGRPRSIPVVPWQQFGPPVWYPYAPWLANDQIMLKHELYERCLEGKGYRLVPDERADTAPADTAPADTAPPLNDDGDAADAG